MRKYTLLLLFVPMFFYSQEKLDVFFDFDKYDLNEVAVKKINSWIAEGKEYALRFEPEPIARRLLDIYQSVCREG